MQLAQTKYVFGALIIGICSNAHSAEWQLDTIDSRPGASAEMTLSLRGDGVTNATVLEIYFDEARLQLPNRRGEIPGASRNGALCSRNADNRIDVFIYNDAKPLPTEQSPVCVLPFKAPANAPNGSAGLELVNAECSGRGTPQACTVKLRPMRVIAPVGAPSPGVANDPLLYVMLKADRNAPSVEALVRFKLSSLPEATPPIQALRVGKPQFVFPFEPFRAAGDFKAYIDADPKSPSAKLQRYAIIRYATTEDRDLAKRAFEEERYVEQVFASIDAPRETAAPKNIEPPKLDLSALGPVARKAPSSIAKTTQSSQSHWALMNFPAAWELTGGGWGLVFIGDNCIELNHNALKSSQFDGTPNASHVGGGNFIPGLSYDIASQDSYSISPVWKMVDEIQPVPTVGGAPANCVGPPYIAQIAGHGTHVAGLIGGSALQTSDQSGGGCLHCGIAMLKIGTYLCQEIQFNPVIFGVKPVAQGSGVNTSLSLASRLGAQVYNASFGLPNVEAAFCDPKGTNAPNNISCVALVRAERLQTILVSATGNNRTRLQFNSNDARVTAVGGTSISGVSLWDESPAGTPGCNAGQPCYHGCPSYIPNIAFDNQVECGANWIPDGVLGFVEISTPAKSIKSLFYHGKTWNSVIACGDGFPAGSSASDGIGLCTGTSMTAPQASALFGLLRSINPLVPAGDPDDPSIVISDPRYGVRNVVAATASRANNRNDELGYGLPNAAAAAELMLGTVRAEPRTNRAIPLFRLYSAGAQDYAATAIPQVASAWSYTQTFSYNAVSTNNSFIGSTPLLAFPSFLSDSTVVPQKPAAAFALVLSTHTSQIASFNTAPIFWVARRKVQGNQCDAISMQCNDSYDHALVDQSRLDSALQNGYEYRGYQGYVYVACDDAPTCNFIKPAPIGTQGLYVVCKPQVDCANALSGELPAFAAQGYNQGWQGANTPSLIGYAYTAVDTDQDGLPNGAEIVAKTNPLTAHSDDDGIADGVEYPFSGVPVSDPCDLNSSCAPPEYVHFNGFEAE